MSTSAAEEKGEMSAPKHEVPTVFAGLLLMLTFIAAWITHIIVAISAKAWMFMIVGALIAPVAIAHGVSVWLGYDWLH